MDAGLGPFLLSGTPGTQTSSPVLLPAPQDWVGVAQGHAGCKEETLWLGRSGSVYTGTEVEAFGLLSVE